MNFASRLVVVLCCGGAVLGPINCFAAGNKINMIPLVEMLQQNKAKISTDKKSIIDLKGEVLAKQTPPPVMKKRDPSAAIEFGNKDKDANVTMIVNCYKKCAMVTRQCYLDDIGNTICLNVCDKEGLVCEEMAN
ncbi:hypothetical protein GMLC_32730 [Geomonas limicola]|uniref:Uncharacterized protein n=1 Tax=Geomonas limicola TaxID=2740186 RepID=A0A6V8NCT5_9BACT|nr:hypothetical protein [Geomonas limicola]GFO69694.1 hypothetical protein GMLC_32730 [Geomonas limicola]